LTRGKTFGEVSLMREEARSATIVAEGEVVLYQLPRKDFLEVIEWQDGGGGDGGGQDTAAGDEDKDEVGGPAAGGGQDHSSRSNPQEWSQDLTQSAEWRDEYEKSQSQTQLISSSQARLSRLENDATSLSQFYHSELENDEDVSLSHLGGAESGTAAEGGGGSPSGLLGSWFEQTTTRLAPLMQRGSLASSTAASALSSHRGSIASASAMSSASPPHQHQQHQHQQPPPEVDIAAATERRSSALSLRTSFARKLVSIVEEGLKEEIGGNNDNGGGGGGGGSSNPHQQPQRAAVGDGSVRRSWKGP